MTSPITVKYLDPDDNGEKQTLLGTIFVQKDGFAYFQFAAGINDTLAKVGDITIDECMIECRLNSSAIGDTERVSLEVGGLTIEIGVEENQKQSPQIISKKGEYDPLQDVVTWTVEIAGGNIDNLNLRLHDTFDEKQDYVAGSFALNGVSISDSELAPEAGGEIGRTLACVLPTPLEPVEGNYTATYQTKPSASLFYREGVLQDLKGVELINTAQLYASGFAFGEPKEAKVSLPNATWMSKTGIIKADKTGIVWTLTLNSVNRYGLNVTVYDVIPFCAEQGGKGPYLTRPASVSAASGSGTIANFAQGFEYKGTDYSQNGIKFDVNGLNGQCVIQYETPLSEKYFEENNRTQTFENQAWMDVRWNPGDGTEEQDFVMPSIAKSGVPVVTSLITKTAGVYNPSNQEIVWTVTVNGNRIDMRNAVVTDVIANGVVAGGSLNQVYVRYDPMNSGATADASDPASPVFTLGNIGRESRTFTVTTRVVDPSFISSNSTRTFQNKVNLSYQVGEQEPVFTASTVSNCTGTSSKMIEKKRGIITTRPASRAGPSWSIITRWR